MSANSSSGLSSHESVSAGTMRARATDRLLDVDDVAALLNVPTRWVRQASRDGRLPCVRLGRYVRFDREDVLAWVEAQKSGGRVAASRKHHPTVRTPGTK